MKGKKEKMGDIWMVIKSINLWNSCRRDVARFIEENLNNNIMEGMKWVVVKSAMEL